MAVTFDQKKCLYCGGCTSVCPQAALELKETYIECDPKKCIDCGICVRFCPAGAIKQMSGKNIPRREE